jgi:hypothetical protein
MSEQQVFAIEVSVHSLGIPYEICGGQCSAGLCVCVCVCGFFFFFWWGVTKSTQYVSRYLVYCMYVLIMSVKQSVE